MTSTACGGLELAARGARQACLGHANVETTMIDTHVIRDLRTPGRSLLDALAE
jgi:hypothetical protein